jgi:Uma2 family endonuclease
MRLLATFVEVRELGEAFTEKALVCLTRNDYEPDICIFGTEKSKSFASDQMQFPAADFVIEVLSEPTAS